MKIAKFLAVVALAASVWPAPVQAQGTPRIDQRQENQDRRIDQGVVSGRLTEREAARLESGQAHVQQLEDQALTDGKVNKKERVRIERAQNRQSRRIARQKHDRQHK